MRNENLEEFLEHEHQAYPPALSQSDLVGCLEDLVTSQEKTNNPDVQVIILDGSATVNGVMQINSLITCMHHNCSCHTMYPKKQHASRVDIIWDEYHLDSLKAVQNKKQENLPQQFLETGKSFYALMKRK